MKAETPHPAVARLEASEREVEALRRTLFDLKTQIDELARCPHHKMHERVWMLQRSTPYSIADLMGIGPDREQKHKA